MPIRGARRDSGSSSAAAQQQQHGVGSVGSPTLRAFAGCSIGVGSPVGAGRGGGGVGASCIPRSVSTASLTDGRLGSSYTESSLLA